METFLIIHIILFRAKIEPLQIKKSENPLKMWILGFSSVIQTRQVETQSKLFCIDCLIPFGFI